MNRAQRRKQKTSKLYVPSFFLDDKALNRSFRSQCSDCHSTSITWHAAEELPMVVPPNREDSAVELLELLGDDAPVCEAWMCRECFNFGVMGAPQGF
jgi:hypothetical protein